MMILITIIVLIVARTGVVEVGGEVVANMKTLNDTNNIREKLSRPCQCVNSQVSRYLGILRASLCKCFMLRPNTQVLPSYAQWFSLQPDLL